MSAYAQLLLVLKAIVSGFVLKAFVSCRAEEGNTTEELDVDFLTKPFLEKENYKNYLAITFQV